MEQTGVNALPIVGLLTFLIGVVIAYQGADYLRFYGLESYTVQLTGASILRELGVLLTAIILAGRSGSAFTAQIGTMRVNEEIDAMRTIGLDPVEVLVLPRLFGLMLTLPMLTLCANFMGVFGGGLMAWGVLGIGIPEFFTHLSTIAPWIFLDRYDQVAVLCRHHRPDRLLRGISGGGQRRKRRPPYDAVGG